MKFRITPWAHQLEAIKRAEKREEFALFFEMGAGKTATAINILRAKFEQSGRLLKTLILCPPVVIQNWKKEFLLHSDINSREIICLEGSGKERLEMFEEWAWKKTEEGDHAASKIFITNFESLSMDRLFLKIASWRPEFLVVDESHKCKDPRAKRTKLTTQLADHTDYRLILSGTPVLNSPMDLFAQFRILDQGDTLGRNFFAFRATYFYDKNASMPKARYFPKWEIKPKSYEELHEKIKPLSMRITKAECLDLPPLVRETMPVPMSLEQRRIYNEMKKDFISYVKGGAAVATLAITKALRLMQIVSGFVSIEAEAGGGRKNIQFENPRADILKELLLEITSHSKCLVWAVFKENYEVIKQACEQIGIRYVEVHGAISAKQKQVHVESFNSDPECKVFIGHPGSGGIGINLVEASYSIFYSRTFSLEQDLQAEARNHRGGSEIHEKITRIDLVCPGTIDELVLKRLENKQEISDKVLKEMADQL